MPSIRPGLRRATIVAVVVAAFSGLLAVPIAAANTSVTGTLTYLERVALTPQAVAIVTIVDQTAAPDAGAVIGQQRIDAPVAVPIDFSVLVDADTIDPTHAYALFATIVDGSSTWQSRVGEPVITGGPTSGIALTLTAVPPTPTASIAGTIVPPAGTQIGPSAVVIAALIKAETGTLVARQVRPIADATELGFAIGFDPALIDPTATYLVKGGIIDGAAVWQNRTGVVAIDGGVATGVVSLPVTRAPTDLPVVSPAPTARPTATAKPTETAGVTASPSPITTPGPTTAPTATAAPTAAPSAAPSNAPSRSPITGPVSGTLTYREPYQLSGDAFAIVALVRGSARASESSIVASEIDRDITSVPVSFELDLGGATIDPSLTYTIQAAIVDGENAWVTAQGIPVLTKGNSSNVAITLSYRPDLLKGAVTGQIAAVGLQPSPGAYAMAVLLDPATGESLGIDVKTIVDGLPVAFSIGYTITDIDPAGDHVVTVEVGDGDATWRNVAGVPVITKGNPKTGIQVVVTEVVAPAPSATPTATPAASPTPVPVPDETSSGALLTWIIVIAIVGAVAAFIVARGRNRPDEPTPVPPPPAATGPSTEATEPAGSAPTAPPPGAAQPPGAVAADTPAADPDASDPR